MILAAVMILGSLSLFEEKLVVASGRKPNTETLIAASADLLLDEDGFVHVDENCCSTLPGVYAIFASDWWH
jgi:dihydrolipoamide dehydrogenase